MKWRNIFLNTFLFLILSLLTINFTLQALTSKNLLQMSHIVASEKQLFVESRSCNSKNMLVNLDKSHDPHILKLNEYQSVCDSFITNRMMIFTDMPKDKSGAQRRADVMTTTLRQFNEYKVTPIVIVEPNTDWGLIDFKEFKGGFYDQWIDLYFKDLKKSGITDEQMGIWVPFPEPNLPYWNRNNSTPADYATNVNKYLTTMKKYFPKAKGSVLLNSATYLDTDFNWANGEYTSLVPYVKDIKPGLVDSFGMQGFPWYPENGSKVTPVVDPAQYLNYKQAIEAASALNVKEIWFNTGTFSSKYVSNPDKIVFVDPSIRKEILNNVIDQAKKAESSGYKVWINLFAQNKSDTTEATNWSYWQDPKDLDNKNRNVLIDFISAAYSSGIDVSLYDTQKPADSSYVIQ